MARTISAAPAPRPTEISSDRELALVARCLTGDHPSELNHRDAGGRLLRKAEVCRDLIVAGQDPLGDALMAIRSPIERRDLGAVYTPEKIINSMVGWAARHPSPVRVVDPGAGSGRFLIAAARAFPEARLVACEIDPLAALILRANATVLGFVRRLDVQIVDYRLLVLPEVSGRTLFIGNPPYVRHHKIAEEGKRWFADTAARLGFKASKLAGLHVHFFLRTREIASPGDFGAFITSSEWMDVNYGSVLRQMLADGLGGSSLQVLSPHGMPFADAMTTGAITTFLVGNRPDEFTVREVGSADDLDDLDAGRRVAWDVVQRETRWSQLVRPPAERPKGMIELGELFRVHRGAVTGGNDVFLEGAFGGDLPQRFLVPAITKAKDLTAVGTKLTKDDAKALRRVIQIPADLAILTHSERKQVDAFRRWARRRGADRTFTAKQRRAWWSVSLRAPAAILCTYMARRAPSFVRNLAAVPHINIAHGLYPRVKMTGADLDAYTDYLNREVCVTSGRTYAGGLVKFEPREVERILVPCLNSIHDALRTDKTMDAKRARGRREDRAVSLS